MKNIMDYLRHTTIEQLLDEVDFTRAIVKDEFNRKESAFNKLPSYAERAIDRLVKLAKPFYSEGNISWEITKRYIHVKCPYCENMMEWHGFSGSTFKCTCGASATISAEIEFKPNKE